MPEDVAAPSLIVDSRRTVFHDDSLWAEPTSDGWALHTYVTAAGHAVSPDHPSLRAALDGTTASLRDARFIVSDIRNAARQLSLSVDRATPALATTLTVSRDGIITDGQFALASTSPVASYAWQEARQVLQDPDAINHQVLHNAAEAVSAIHLRKKMAGLHSKGRAAGEPILSDWWHSNRELPDCETIVTQAMVATNVAAGRLIYQAQEPCLVRLNGGPLQVWRATRGAQTSRNPAPYARVTSPLQSIGDLVNQQIVLALSVGRPSPYTEADLERLLKILELGFMAQSKSPPRERRQTPPLTPRASAQFSLLSATAFLQSAETILNSEMALPGDFLVTLEKHITDDRLGSAELAHVIRRCQWDTVAREYLAIPVMACLLRNPARVDKLIAAFQGPHWDSRPSGFRRDGLHGIKFTLIGEGNNYESDLAISQSVELADNVAKNSAFATLMGIRLQDHFQMSPEVTLEPGSPHRSKVASREKFQDLRMRVATILERLGLADVTFSTERIHQVGRPPYRVFASVGTDTRLKAIGFGGSQHEATEHALKRLETLLPPMPPPRHVLESARDWPQGAVQYLTRENGWSEPEYAITEVGAAYQCRLTVGTADVKPASALGPSAYQASDNAARQLLRDIGWLPAIGNNTAVTPPDIA